MKVEKAAIKTAILKIRHSNGKESGFPEIENLSVFFMIKLLLIFVLFKSMD
jgi:hypothetical protein